MTQAPLRLVIDSRLDEVRRIRQAIGSMTVDDLFTTEEWQQVKTCVDEAVNNAVIHAYGMEPGNEVKVEVRLEPDRVVCIVTDSGHPVPEEARIKPRLEVSPEEIEDLPEGGMGLYIMHAVMDRIEYESKNGCNVLTMTKFAGKRNGSASPGKEN